MSLFTVDQERCKRDGICVKECPTRIIELTDKEALPSPVENAAENCLNCGHCVAVCPHGALTLKTMPLDECPPVQKELLPDAEQLKQFLTSRRSIRRFKNKSVDHALLAELIDTARYAPTGSNKQQVHWTVFENADKVKSLASLVIDWTKLMVPKIPDEAMLQRMQRMTDAWDKGKDVILHGAPHLIMVHSPANLPSAQTDCVIALTYLELYAASQGLGTCWAGYLTTVANAYAPMGAALGLPEGHSCFGAVMIGYPRYEYTRIPKRNTPLLTWR